MKKKNYGINVLTDLYEMLNNQLYWSEYVNKREREKKRMISNGFNH